MYAPKLRLDKWLAPRSSSHMISTPCQKNQTTPTPPSDLLEDLPIPIKIQQLFPTKMSKIRLHLKCPDRCSEYFKVDVVCSWPASHVGGEKRLVLQKHCAKQNSESLGQDTFKSIWFVLYRQNIDKEIQDCEYFPWNKHCRVPSITRGSSRAPPRETRAPPTDTDWCDDPTPQGSCPSNQC